MLNIRHCQLKELIHCCYNNVSFTIAFLSAKDKFLRCKVHSVRHTFLTFTWVKLCKRPKVNSKPTHFLNNGKVFPSLDDMTCSYQYSNQLQLLQGHWQAKRYWISRDLQKPDLSENNYNNTRNNMKSHIKNKKNRSISLWNSLYQHKQFL